MAFSRPPGNRGPAIVHLNGKVVLITGASRGIGEACARAFARRGARLILTARSVETLERIRREIDAAKVRALAADLERPEQVAELANRALECWGGVDVLVNNAGVGLYVPGWRADADLVRRMTQVNFFAPCQLIAGLAPAMRRRGEGVIVNVSSVAGKVPLPWLTLYSATKAAMNALSDGLRMELRGTGVRVVSVCPGYVRTDFAEHALGGRIPASLASRRRFAITAQECAAAIVEGVEKEKRTVVTPRSGWVLVALARVLPRAADALLARLQGPRMTEEPECISN